MMAGLQVPVRLHQGDFFKFQWEDLLLEYEGPLLVTGNPPWVTSSELGSLASDNLPAKSNFQGRAGIDAITGKSNFDISEWMLLRYLDWTAQRGGWIAVLCKTAVARKILLHSWKKSVGLRSARIYKIDALRHFAAAVDACLFVVEVVPGATSTTCELFDTLESVDPVRVMGYVDGHLVSDVEAFHRCRGLQGLEDAYTWRSGIKHDCSKVMELTPTSKGFSNKLGEEVALEPESVYPLLKSSDVGNGRLQSRNVVIVTQQFVGQSTDYLREQSPQAWAYLHRHKALLDARSSVIYRNKPSFSIFGIGPYSFAPWKVAVSGFYKKLNFVVVGPVDARPVFVDDTIYFLPCQSEEEAVFIQTLLMSKPAQDFFESMVHWDEKRPITVELLRRLSLRKLSALLGRHDDYQRLTRTTDVPPPLLSADTPAQPAAPAPAAKSRQASSPRHC